MLLISLIFVNQILIISPVSNNSQDASKEKPDPLRNDQYTNKETQNEFISAFDPTSDSDTSHKTKEPSNREGKNPITIPNSSSHPFENVVSKVCPPSMENNEVNYTLTISSDADLLSKAQSNNWNGTGTDSDPIIIANYNFTGGSPAVRLSVTDVQLYFVIMNCMFDIAANSTIFHNASNAIIKGNIFFSAAYFGLFLDDESDNNVVVYNIFNNTGSGGINANDNGTLNTFRFNYWDDMSGSAEGGIYTDYYWTDGTGGSYDEAPREFKQYWNHPELTFDSEAILKSEARNYGILGNGSKNNPFRIEYTNFSKPSETPLIRLSNTDSFIVIRNCSFYGGGFVDGIYLYDVSNVTIENAEIRNCINGIYAEYDSSHIDISNVDISHCSSNGLYVDNTNHTIYSDCFIEQTRGNGVYLSACFNTTFYGCTITNSSSYGFYVVSCENTKFQNSSVFDNKDDGCHFLGRDPAANINTTLDDVEVHNNLGYGIYFEESVDATINDTILRNNYYGMYLYYGSNNTLINNCDVIDNSFDGIAFIYASYNTIVTNTNFINNSNNGLVFSAISGVGSEDCIVDSTNVSHSSVGITLRDGYNITLKRLNIANCTSEGISIISGFGASYGHTLSMIDVQNCTIGIEEYAWVSSTDQLYNNSFQHMNISNCGTGVSLISYHTINPYPLIARNLSFLEIYGCSIGIELEYIEHSQMDNCYIHDNDLIGVFMDRVSETSFTSNIFKANGVAVNITDSSGIFATHNNTFTGNFFINNDAWDNGSDTHWNNTIQGNYWSSYTGVDDNRDGIGDTSYDVPGTPGGFDYKPLYFDPIILIPYNQTYTQADIPIIILNSTNVESCWIQYYFEGSWSPNQALTWNGSHWTLARTWIQGNYRLRAYCNNSLGLEFSSEVFFTYTPTEPSEPPNIMLLFPENNSILNSDVYVFLEIVGSNGSYIYNWDTGQNNTLNVSEPISFPTIDGLHSLEVFACNSMGDWQYAYFEFTVDDTDPTIQPYDVSDGAEVGNGTWIPFEVNDTHYEMFWYYWVDEDDQSSEIVYTTVPGTVAPATPGDWELHVYANDTAGNVAEMTLDLQILQAVPLGLVYPVGGEYITGYCYIMWVSNENLQVDLSYSPDGGVTWISIASDITETKYLWDTTNVANGTEYQVRVVSTTPGKPGEDHSANDFTIYNDPLPPGTSIYSLPEISVRIVLSEPTDVSIQRMFNVSFGLQSDPEFFYDTGLFVNITLENPDALVSMNITFSYATIEDELISQGLNISELSVYFWNETSFQWEPADTVEIDETNKVVMGYFEHSTVIGVLGRSKASKRGGNPFLLFFIAAVTVLAALGGAFLIYEHRLRTSQGDSSIIDKLRKLFVEQFQKKDE
jgi:parallel beta-helix repeat protein